MKQDSQENKYRQWKNEGNRRMIFLMLIAAGLLLLVKFFGQISAALRVILHVMMPFIAGGCIAFVLNVPMRGIERALFGKGRIQQKPVLKKLARPVSLFLTFLLLIIFIIVYVLVLVPQLRETVSTIVASAQEFFPKAEAWFESTFSYDTELVQYIEGLDWNGISSQISGFLHSGISAVLSSGVNVVVSVVSGITTFVIGIVFSFYVLMQKEKLGNQASRLIRAIFSPKTAERICSIASLTHNTFTNFVRGQCLEAIILGLMFMVTMTIFRIPYALLIGVLITITALIPIFGAFIGCALSTLMILMVDPFKAFIFVILFLVLQQLEGNLIYPHVVGSSVGLPSMWVLVAVTVGGGLMGIFGMLVFIPVTSVVYTLIRNWVNEKNAHSELALRKEASAQNTQDSET